MFVFAYHPNLESNAAFPPVFQEFQFYKIDSAPDEHAAPTRHIQENYPSNHPLFGRDRFDKFNYQASKEDIQHLHVKQSDSIWEDEDGPLYQWDCTSNSYLIYSYFLHNEKHHYFVIEFFQNSAHKKYEHQVPYFIQEAKKYRLSVIS